MRAGLRVSDRLYAALLHLYPRPFHAAYAQPMRLTFQDACRAAFRRGGVGGLLALWLPTLLDLLRSALAEWARQGELTMLRERLMAWAGPLTILVGALWLLTASGDLAFQTGLLTDEALLGLVILPFFLSFVPLLFAVLGTRLRFSPGASRLGRLGLGLSVIGSVGVILAVPLSALSGGAAPAVAAQSWVSYATVVCLLSLRVGYLLFGVDALRTRPLPRWNPLPLLLGLTVVLSLPFEWFGVPALVPVPWASPFLHFALSGACWVLLGLALMSPQRVGQPTAAA
jgi:hypothetical protein